MKVLISGILGDIGLSTSRIAQKLDFISEIHGIDIKANEPSNKKNKFTIAPSAESPNYLEFINNYLKKHKIDIFIPTSEQEIQVISDLEDKIYKATRILINGPEIINICFDKDKTMKFLDYFRLPTPSHGIVGLSEPEQFPVIVKPRRGRGSQNVEIISNSKLLSRYGSEFIWQELLLPDDEEYTCAVFVSKTKKVRILILKRTLKNGISNSGVVVKDSIIQSYVLSITKKLNFSGCINIQLRKTKKGPILFEINPRLSSTVFYRHEMGFSDLKWWIEDKCESDISSYHEPEAGTSFVRIE